MLGASHLQDGQRFELNDNVLYQVRRCEPMPKGLALYRLTPIDGPNAGSLEFALTEREIAMNKVGYRQLH